MKCYQQPNLLKNRPTPITEIWEVRLNPALWTRIVDTARARRCTYSCVTRYCIFRLVEKANVHPAKAFWKSQKKATRELRGGSDLHRHMACFYGEDIRLVKLVALQLGVTVTALIRIALQLYLPRLAADFHSKRHVSREAFLAFGIKRWMFIPIAALNLERAPVLRNLAFASFPPWLRW